MKDELDTFCGQLAAGEEVAFRSVPVGAKFRHRGKQFKKINDLGVCFANFLNAEEVDTKRQACFDMRTRVRVWSE